MGQGIGMRADGRLSRSKGEGRVRVSLVPERNRTPHLRPLPFCEGRGGVETAVDLFGANRIGLKPIINES